MNICVIWLDSRRWISMGHLDLYFSPAAFSFLFSLSRSLLLCTHTHARLHSQAPSVAWAHEEIATADRTYWQRFNFLCLYLRLASTCNQRRATLSVNYCGGSSLPSTGLGDKNLRTYLGKWVFSCAFNMVDRENVLPHMPHRKGRSPVSFRTIIGGEREWEKKTAMFSTMLAINVSP